MRRFLRTVPFAVALALMAVVGLSCGSDDNTTGPGPDPEPLVKITTWAGTGEAGFDGDGNALLQSQFYWPIDVEFTPSHNAMFVDWNNHKIRQLQGDGTLLTVMGTELFGDGPDFPNIGADTSQWWPATECALNHPTRVQEMANGQILVTAWHNHKMRVLDMSTSMEKVIIGRADGCQGDGSTVNAVRLNQQSHGIEGPDGAIYILDQRNQTIRRIDLNANTCATIAGQPTCSDIIPGGFEGDGGPPAQSKLNFPTGRGPNPGGGLAFDNLGRLYISDTLNHRIRRIDFQANIITTVVGNGNAAYSGDGGNPVQASLNHPLDIEFGPDGRLYIADAFNHRIRAVDFTINVIVTVAGSGVQGFGGDGGEATEAKLDEPRGIAFDYEGNLIIADTYNHRYRKVHLAQKVQLAQ
jgi:hypothetical protein